MLISTYLQQQGCRIYYAHDGIDGIHKARLLVPDLVLMDLNMPRCNGRIACKMLHEDPLTSHVPVIFLSAYSEPEQRVQGLLAGAVDFIGKPFDFDEVRLRLAIHLQHRNQTPSGAGTQCRAEVELPRPENSVTDDSHLNEILFHGARIHLLSALADAPGIQELASLVGTNTKRLNQAFKYCTGITVFEYLREERMKEAGLLLQNTRLPISDIALRVGFTSSANFSTAFKERFGIPPSRYRRRTGSENPQ